MTFSKTHGQTNSPTHRSWEGMRQRCLNPRAVKFPHYGGRGITVCERWNKFENFLADMGTRPDGTSIDRIDVDGNYEPGNCRWATIAEQANNRTNSIRITAGGMTLTLTEWSERTGISRHVLEHRVREGLDPESAVTLPPRAQRTHCKNGHSIAETGTVSAGRWRRCRECSIQISRRFRAKLAQKGAQR